MEISGSISRQINGLLNKNKMHTKLYAQCTPLNTMQANKSTLCYEKSHLPQIQAFCHLSTFEIKHQIAHFVPHFEKKKKKRKRLSDKALCIFTEFMKWYSKV